MPHKRQVKFVLLITHHSDDEQARITTCETSEMAIARQYSVDLDLYRFCRRNDLLDVFADGECWIVDARRHRYCVAYLGYSLAL